MFGRQIFRTAPLEKMMTPDDLDELLQVNSPGTWLIFTAISITLAGLLVWGVFGTISHHVKGFGILKTEELPREVVSECTGQVDSIFCRNGDKVAAGKKLVRLIRMEDKTGILVYAQHAGEVTGLEVREGSYVQTGTSLLEMIRSADSGDIRPEVIFFATEADVAKLKAGMVSILSVSREGFPTGSLTATINFITCSPVSKISIQRYFPGTEMSKQLGNADYHEVRATLAANGARKQLWRRAELRLLNGLPCRVVTTVSRQSPMAALFK